MGRSSKKCIVIIVLFLLSILSLNAATFSIKGGPTYGTMEWGIEDIDYYWDSSPSIGFSVIGDIGFSFMKRFELDIGVGYTQKGEFLTQESGDFLYEDDYTFSYLSIPLQLRFIFLPKLSIRPYTIFGASLGIPIGAKEHYKEIQLGTTILDTTLNLMDIDEFDFYPDYGWSIGTGLEFRLGSTSPYIEIVYDYGLADIFEFFGDTTKQTTSTLMLNFGLRFGPREKKIEVELPKTIAVEQPPKKVVEPETPEYMRAPPDLVYTYDLIDEDGNKVLDGGERVSLIVEVTNRGNGIAKGVKVELSGDSQVIDYFGKEKYLGDINSGERKEAMFETVLPYRIKAEDANLTFRVIEEKGFDALKEIELQVATAPAKVEKEREVISVLIDVDQPIPPSAFKRDKAYAIIIGISNYRSNKIPEVKYAKRDAEIIKEYLINIVGIPEGNIISLINEGATKSDLEAYIEEYLNRNVDENTFVFLYFAGHGTPDLEKGIAYLVPYDGEPGFISKLYPLERLYSSLEELPTEDIVVFIDACFSGAGGRSIIEEGKRPLIPVKIPKTTEKLAVITASSGDEISQDYNAKKHGLFTYYILKGLRGESDIDGDDWITFGELYDYIKPKVLDESRRMGYTQTPRVIPEPLGEKASIKVGKVR